MKMKLINTSTFNESPSDHFDSILKIILDSDAYFEDQLYTTILYVVNLNLRLSRCMRSPKSDRDHCNREPRYTASPDYASLHVSLYPDIHSMRNPLSFSAAKSLTGTFIYIVRSCRSRDIKRATPLKSSSNSPRSALYSPTPLLRSSFVKPLSPTHPRTMVDRQGNVSPAPEYPKPLKELAFPSPSARYIALSGYLFLESLVAERYIVYS